MRGCWVILRKASRLAIVSNLFGECHAACTLKTSFVDLGKDSAHGSCHKRLHF